MRQKILNNLKNLSKAGDRAIGCLCYLGILVLVPLIVRYRSDFVRFHLRQGLSVFAIEIMLLFVIPIPLVGIFLGLLGWLICGIFSILGLISALRGRYYKIPLISFLADKLGIP